MRVSQKILDYDVELSSIVTYGTTNMTRSEISADQVAAITAAKETWDTALALYISPSTHTSEVTQSMQNLYQSTNALTSGLKQQLKNNRNITLTAADYQNMFIHKDVERRARVPVPQISPINTLIDSKHLLNRIFSISPLPGFEQVTGLPKDVKAIGRAICIKAMDADPPSRSQYHTIESSGNTQYSLVFDPENENMKAYLITWYINNRGEIGPESEPFSFLII